MPDNKLEKEIIPNEAKETLKEQFKVLEEKVVLEVFTKGGENDPFNELTKLFTKEIASLSDKIVVNYNEIGDEKSKKYNVTRSPTILFNPSLYQIRFTGAPIGEEGRSFLMTIMMVSKRESDLSKQSKEIISNLDEKRHIQVFVTPTCPYCPGQVINAFRAAIERPDLISSECVESAENNDLANKFNVSTVPQTVINEEFIFIGLKNEEKFISEVVTLEPTEELISENMDEHKEVDLIVVGGGPAGLTAGIYAERSGLKTVILEKDTLGGQVSITPIVENYPGFEIIPGKKLMDLISSHARNYVNIIEGEEVKEIKVGKKIETITNKNHYIGKALIIATGAKHKKLNVPGEQKFRGHGVSYCATCDGYFYKNKQVIMVGGGNTALTESLYLKSLGANVTIVHWKDQMSAEKHLQDSIERENIKVLWNTTVDEIIGKDKITGAKLKKTKGRKRSKFKTDGIFVAIGYTPYTQLAEDIGIKLADDGFIKIDRSCRTNIPRIYAAGDVAGGVRQIVTAVSEGSIAAMSAFEDISNPYWKTKKK